MERKGLCSSCVNDKECVFERKFPVLQCEEFSDYESRLTRGRPLKQKHKRIESSKEPEAFE